MNKKAIEINVATIIIVILAILVLVILALYFTGGMKSLWERITPVPAAYDQTDLEGARNVCTLYCSGGQETLYCTKEFRVRVRDKDGKVTGTEIKYCDDDKIRAAKEPECIAAGFDKIDCSAKRNVE